MGTTNTTRSSEPFIRSATFLRTDVTRAKMAALSLLESVSKGIIHI